MTETIITVDLPNRHYTVTPHSESAVDNTPTHIHARIIAAVSEHIKRQWLNRGFTPGGGGLMGDGGP